MSGARREPPAAGPAAARAPRRRARWGLAGGAVALALAALTAGLGGCSTVAYLAQSADGHLRLMAAARPVADVMADPATPAALRERLALAQRMRDFAVAELKLPDNRSYRSYADLHRPAAVWNVVAAPELSLRLETWCFPLVGCVGYRGYYSLDRAEAAAAPLRAKGLDVSVYPVPAYSTLGWMNWTGGDPLLNTFIDWPEPALARLIFHELAHQEAYAAGDTTFNESFAVAVERLGVRRWLAAHPDEAAAAAQQAAERRRADFLALVRTYRAKLEALYASPAPDADKRRGKAALFAAMRADEAALRRDRWGGWTGYDAWFAHANNASMGAQAAYDERVPTFERLFHRDGDDFARFYADVRRLAGLPRDARDRALAAVDREAAPGATPARAPETSSGAAGRDGPLTAAP